MKFGSHQFVASSGLIVDSRPSSRFRRSNSAAKPCAAVGANGAAGATGAAAGVAGAAVGVNGTRFDRKLMPHKAPVWADFAKNPRRRKIFHHSVEFFEENFFRRFIYT